MAQQNAVSSDWKPLYTVGGIAALLAALLFRRNIGAEVSLFTGVDAIPTSIVDWYALLQTSPFVGLSFLAFFDLANYALEGIVFLALGAAFWSTRRSVAAMALGGGLVGIAVSFAANISVYCLTFAFSPVLQAILMSSGGALWMIWHLLVARVLFKRAKE